MTYGPGARRHGRIDLVVLTVTLVVLVSAVVVTVAGRAAGGAHRAGAAPTVGPLATGPVCQPRVVEQGFALRRGYGEPDAPGASANEIEFGFTVENPCTRPVVLGGLDWDDEVTALDPSGRPMRAANGDQVHNEVRGPGQVAPGRRAVYAGYLPDFPNDPEFNYDATRVARLVVTFRHYKWAAAGPADQTPTSRNVRVGQPDANGDAGLTFDVSAAPTGGAADTLAENDVVVAVRDHSGRLLTASWSHYLLSEPPTAKAWFPPGADASKTEVQVSRQDR